MAQHPGAIGRPGPGVEYRLIHETGRNCLVDEVGELQIHTRTVMNGYLGSPELTASTFDGDFFRTGDLAMQGPDGIVAVVGRSKELISRGGNKVYPLEIELLVQAHPSIEHAMATGVPDDLMGERIHVAIVPVEGTQIDLEVLKQWIAERIEKYKIPDAIHIVSTLPAGRTGKADRGQLRARLVEEINSKPGCLLPH